MKNKESMKKINLQDVNKYVEEHISSFHIKRLGSLQTLKLKQILKRKNPYLFKAKAIMTSQDLVKTLLDAHLSSQEETIFGEFMEGLAIFICGKVYKGRKSTTPGIDLEFESKNKRYIISIKSGPNWGNSSQINKMVDYFTKAQKTHRTNNPKGKEIVAVNGCCYGVDKKPDKGSYYKYCGQVFWKFISGNKDLYIDIIEPVGYKAKEKNEEFWISYSQIIEKFTREFMNDFCENDKIDWAKLVHFNSAFIVK